MTIEHSAVRISQSIAGFHPQYILNSTWECKDHLRLVETRSSI
jgi:hypothetical protein